MGANNSYKTMYNIAKQAKERTIFIPDDFTMYSTPDTVRSGLTHLYRNKKLHYFAKEIYYIPMYDNTT